MAQDPVEQLAWILPSTPAGEQRRFILLTNDHVRLQTLTVEGQVAAQVEVTLSEIGAFVGVLERLTQPPRDPVLRKLRAEQEGRP